MKYLKITECISCPFVYTNGRDENNEVVPDDMFYVKCEHEHQSNTEGFVAKLKNKYNRIYFNCPL